MYETNSENLIPIQLRELALIDRIIGLESEIVQLKIQAGYNDLRTLHQSRAWRVGRFVLSPLILLKRVFKR